MTVALVFYEGVLQTSKDRPLLDGFLLVQALGQSYRLVVATSGTQERVEHQLRTERLQDLVTEVVDKTADLPPLPLWQRQIESVRSKYGIALMLSADPEMVAWSLERRVTSLLFAHPGYARPPYRPEQGSRSWERLVEELEVRP
jgi:hypothetical protein